MPLLPGDTQPTHLRYCLTCITILDNLNYQDDCQNALVRLQILTVPCIYIQDCIIYTKKTENLFVKHSSVHTHLTRHRENFRLNDFRLTKSRNSTNYHCIKFFNTLPTEIRNLPTDIFLKKMKTYLIEKAFYFFVDYLQNDFSDFRF
nr:unnamed protein product [Callosobruchus analis]